MVKNSKILVAGGSGFIGSNLISKLLSAGNEVISLSIKQKKINNKIGNAKYVYHDLTKPIPKDKYKLFSDVEYLVNCSGYINHKNFMDGGKKIFNEHFDSVYTLTNLAIELKIKSFIHLGSSDEYGTISSPIKESCREAPISPYALGKLASTHYLRQCYEKKILNTVVLRPFLVFGENQNKDRFLPYLINNCLNNREFKVSKGEQIRDYLYVEDFNRAIIKSMTNMKAFGQIINIASGTPISIREVIEYVKQIIGKGKPIYGGLDYRNGESMELYANIEKAKNILDWEPKYDFLESLKKVINWFQEND